MAKTIMELALLTGGIRTSKGFRIGLLALILLSLLSGLILAQNDWDAQAFVMMGAMFRDGDPAGNMGYDGQFVYYIAADPLNAAAHIDAPAYRYQRILYPFLAWVLSLGGDAALLPWAMLLINIVAAAAACAVLGELLQRKGVEVWHALAFLFSAGVLIALRADLNEPLAMLFALVGLALALIHHLAIGNKVPLDSLAQLMQTLSRWLVIEFIPKEDENVKRRLAYRKDIFDDYDEASFERAYFKRFKCLDRVKLPESQRILYLLERRG